MPYWLLPPMPGFSKFLFASAAIILVFGLFGYVIERRKELRQKERQ